MKKQSWFNKIRQGAINKGITINGMVHKASPVMDGKKVRSAKCPKCPSHNGVVFRSHMDGKLFILFCQKCGKFTPRYKKGAVQKDVSDRCHALTRQNNRCGKRAVDGDLCSIHRNMASAGKEVKLVSTTTDKTKF